MKNTFAALTFTASVLLASTAFAGSPYYQDDETMAPMPKPNAQHMTTKKAQSECNRRKFAQYKSDCHFKTI